MEETIRTYFESIYSADREAQHHAFMAIIALTDAPVDWAYEVWDELPKGLTHKNNRVRAITSQILINLAKSDPENRMQKAFPALLAITKDERFVTARHCLQNLWKIGLAGDVQKKQLLNGLEARFQECVVEKNCTLIRYDILQVLRNLYDELKDEGIKALALRLIETEDDLKYKKKYMGLWKK